MLAMSFSVKWVVYGVMQFSLPSLRFAKIGDVVGVNGIFPTLCLLELKILKFRRIWSSGAVEGHEHGTDPAWKALRGNEGQARGHSWSKKWLQRRYHRIQTKSGYWRPACPTLGRTTLLPPSGGCLGEELKKIQPLRTLGKRYLNRRCEGCTV